MPFGGGCVFYPKRLTIPSAQTLFFLARAVPAGTAEPRRDLTPVPSRQPLVDYKHETGPQYGNTAFLFGDEECYFVFCVLTATSGGFLFCGGAVCILTRYRIKKTQCYIIYCMM